MPRTRSKRAYCIVWFRSMCPYPLSIPYGPSTRHGEGMDSKYGGWEDVTGIGDSGLPSHRELARVVLQCSGEWRAPFTRRYVLELRTTVRYVPISVPKTYGDPGPRYPKGWLVVDFDNRMRKIVPECRNFFFSISCGKGARCILGHDAHLRLCKVMA
jgi:hypothetical protein